MPTGHHSLNMPIGYSLRKIPCVKYPRVFSECEQPAPGLNVPSASVYEHVLMYNVSKAKVGEIQRGVRGFFSTEHAAIIEYKFTVNYDLTTSH
mmetsp:Transcript_15984/g.27563  ORF Transcript_15984/g.27563 Transcript_15984/m.27563 type:complete len:93 (+) Transcript_15984:184-462(+)